MYQIGEEEIAAARRVIESRQLFRYSMGGSETETAQMEREWAEKVGAKYCIGVTSGTASLICALAGMGIGAGDEVIVPGYTFIASALAVLAVGGIPIIAEVDESLTLDPVDVEKKITPRTKAILPVHMVGLPCNMDALTAIARKHNLKILEDACQADGGSYKGRRLGTIGDAGGFSFNYFKIISCGDGGAMVTDNLELYERALIQHDGGCVFFRDPEAALRTPFFAGWAFRMNEILSAIVRVQIRRLDDILGSLRAEKAAMRMDLAQIKGFRMNPVNDIEGDCGTTMAILFDTVERSNAFMRAMAEQGAGVSSPINSGRHVYSNWEAIMNQRGGHHPSRDPYKQPGVSVEYSPDMCPNTLNILARTVYLGVPLQRSGEDRKAFLKKVRTAAAQTQ